MSGYTDSLGIDIPPITTGVGQAAIGPALGYRFVTEDNAAIDTKLRFEGITDIVTKADDSGFDGLRGRIEGSVDFTFPGGAALGFIAAYDGISSEQASASAKVKLSISLL